MSRTKAFTSHTAAGQRAVGPPPRSPTQKRSSHTHEIGMRDATELVLLRSSFMHVQQIFQKLAFNSQILKREIHDDRLYRLHSTIANVDLCVTVDHSRKHRRVGDVLLLECDVEQVRVGTSPWNCTSVTDRGRRHFIKFICDVCTRVFSCNCISILNIVPIELIKRRSCR